MKLFIVATPIGNYKDITYRALEILREVDFVICEEYKEAKRLLSNFEIEKELLSLNEHNEEETSDEIIKKILEGRSAALISDCGTPLFSDPGELLISLCIKNNIQIAAVPGANSILPALVGSGFDISKFYYYGWLSPKKEIRRKELGELKKRKELIVIMETPYRLKALLTDAVKIFGEKLPVTVAFQLTMENEKFFRGNAGSILKIAEEKNLKGEFVLIIDNLGK